MTDQPAMTGEELERDALELIKLSLYLEPEGEGMDLTDREYSLENIIRLKGTLSRMRSGIDATNRALAAAWFDQYGNVGTNQDGEHYWLAPNTTLKFQENMSRPFAEWLKAQDPETIEAIVPAYGVRRGQFLPAVRDTFFDVKETSKDRRIQNKPQSKRKAKENGDT
jgi:hypothetical protein